jgi:DNA-directed RNA polymerase sigma subunit (sigma70/sigma32)
MAVDSESAKEFAAWATENGVTISNPAMKRRYGKVSRNLEIFAARNAGETLASIGKRHGITFERVRQICAREERRRKLQQGYEAQQAALNAP